MQRQSTIESHRHRNMLSTRSIPCRPLLLQSIPEEDWLSDEDAMESTVVQIPPHRSEMSDATPFLICNDRALKSLVALARSEIVQLIQCERSTRGLRPFVIPKVLTRLAARHANGMAKLGMVFHSVDTIEELQLVLSCAQVAENVQRGDCAMQMHAQTMKRHGSRRASTSVITRANVLSKQFTKFGCGVALGSDGRFYCCQLFRT
jgi:Cysteine-rich secretory protein family